jgi:hypothetical protein
MDEAKRSERDSRREPTRIVPMTEVHCPRGHVMKVPAEFAADGRTFYCRECGGVFTPGTNTVDLAVKEITVGLPRGKLRLPRWKDLKSKLVGGQQLKPRPGQDVEVECPAGHSLVVSRDMVEAGKEFFCPVCRQTFRPGGEEAAPAALKKSEAPEPGIPDSRAKADVAAAISPARQGLLKIAEGCGLLARASWRQTRKLFSSSGG